jgi:hypothetical protein
VHESIHSFLYIIEEKYHFLADRSATGPIKVTSPWTGRVLDLHSFLHACHVWFGLWQFWGRAIHAGVFDESIARKYHDESRAGFDKPSLNEALDRASRFLSTWTRDRLFELVADVRRGVYG